MGNNLVDKGFFPENADVISVTCISEMIAKTKSEYGLTCKVSEMYLNVKDHQLRVKSSLLALPTARARMYKHTYVLCCFRVWCFTYVYVCFHTCAKDTKIRL